MTQEPKKLKLKVSVGWSEIAAEYGCTVSTLKKQLTKVMKELDQLAGRKNYRLLTPAQVKIIKKQLDGE